MHSEQTIRELLSAFTVPEPDAEAQQRLLHSLRLHHVPPRRPRRRRFICLSPRVTTYCWYAAAALAVWMVFLFITSPSWKSLETRIAQATSSVVSITCSSYLSNEKRDGIADVILWRRRELARLVAEFNGTTSRDTDRSRSNVSAS